MNQCDGCRSGAPDMNGFHYDDKGLPYMVCQAAMYEPKRIMGREVEEPKDGKCESEGDT